MNERFDLFLSLLLLVVGSLIAAWTYYHLRARRFHDQGWEAMLARVVPLDKGSLRIVALDLLGDADGLNERDGPCELGSSEILDLIGDLEGLRLIAKNCEALIDIACYCQRVYPEALIIAEELRLNAREIKWHLDRLNAAARNGSSRAAFGDYAQRIAAIYYLMTRRLLELYEATNAPGVHEVQAALS
jgi:hypothetical protein